jgi:hypothetical protein
MASENRYHVGNDQYATPEWIRFGLFRDWVDPCPLNTSPIQDGLAFEWRERTFVNPPYSDPLPWVEKAIQTVKKGISVALLLKHDTSTKWWAKLHEAGAHFLPVIGRISFDGRNAAPFPSVIVILYPEAS